MTRIWQAVREHRRLEQPRIQIAHHLRPGHRRQIHRPLMTPLRPKRLAEREKHHHAAEQQRHYHQHQQ
jgi:hypothetical protein